MDAVVGPREGRKDIASLALKALRYDAIDVRGKQRLASAYLQQMTNGQYERIVLKMGSQELQAEHRDFGAIGSAALSRGTAEQLYLSMRLALAEAVSHHRNIPILLDDLFVNFDAARLNGVISVLKEVSLKRQIVMMTCHPHVVEGIQAQIPQAQVVNLA